MIENTLLVSQKNEVLNLIKKTALDPFNFRWSEEYSKRSSEKNRPITVSKLSYENTPYYFTFDFNNQTHYSFFSPGKDKLHEQQYPGDWNNQKHYVLQWLTYLEREVQQPDLWNEILKQNITFKQKVSSDIGNEPFSVSQADQIAAGIDNVRKYLLSEFKDDAMSKELINEKIDYLIDASKRQGRQDWFHTCIGVFAGIGTALAMSPDQAHNMWILLKSAISGIIKLLPL